MSDQPFIDFNTLSEQLDGELYSDDLRRYMLSTDGSIFKKLPACVVYPKNESDVSKIVDFASRKQLSIHSRGAGSGLCGAALGDGIVVDFTKFMNRLLSLDLENKTFECEPGYRFGELENELKETGLFFPPDPSSGEYASFGGMYGTNASGAHSVKYGNVADYIADATIKLVSGENIVLSEIEKQTLEKLPKNLGKIAELYQNHQETFEKSYPEIKCNVAGYNLRNLLKNGKLSLHRLFAGSEGTLGVVTRLTFRLIEKPTFDSMVVAFFDDIIKSAKAVQKVMPMNPAGIEIMDKSLLNLAREHDEKLKDKIPGDVENVLLIEFDDFNEEEAKKAAEKAKTLLESAKLPAQIHLAASEEEKARFWAVRKAAVPILYKLKGEQKILALIEDAAVPIDGLVGYFEGIYEILNKYGVRFVVYGHIAKGLMHTRPLLNLKDEKDISMLKPMADDVYNLVTKLDGTVSGEHGDGRLRSVYVKRRYPEIYPLFVEIKKILDPDNLLNPEIIINEDESLVNTNLRFGADYQGNDSSDERLRWNEGFLNQVEMCHGCSKCTTITTATRMCPIFKYTRDEAASPKAKANVLRAIVSNAVKNQAMVSKQFQEVIDYCVNCGSCYQECPSNVNIPKLALEAKARINQIKGVKFHNRVVSNIETTAKLTGGLSPILTPLLNTKFSKAAMEKLFDISSKRNPVAFSKTPLKKRIKKTEGSGGKRVLYFAGCYASYIRPEIGEAAVYVLNKLGFEVIIPDQHCCGLPMLSKGLVKEAKSKIVSNLDKWESSLNTVDYIVVTCSSCGLSLDQEWSYLLDDTRIQKVKDKLIHISSLVNKNIKNLKFTSYRTSVGYHMPCHLKVQADPNSTIKMLNLIPGIEVNNLDSHCCGMAGSWGLAKDNYELSKTIGEQMIGQLESSGTSIGATDCPTCRMQMEEFSGKNILHPIELVAKATREDAS